MEKSDLPKSFEDFEYEYNRFEWPELLDMGYRLHRAALQRARAWASGHPWNVKDLDVVPELRGEGFPFTGEGDTTYEGILEYWNEEEARLSTEDLKPVMKRGLYRNGLSIHTNAGGVCIPMVRDSVEGFNPDTVATIEGLRRLLEQVDTDEVSACQSYYDFVVIFSATLGRA